MQRGMISVKLGKYLWLHLLLVVGTFAYMFSPLLDHWLGNDAQVRAHNHTPISLSVAGFDDPAPFDQHDPHHNSDEHHIEGFICTLDLTLYLVPFFLLP